MEAQRDKLQENLVANGGQWVIINEDSMHYVYFSNDIKFKAFKYKPFLEYKRSTNINKKWLVYGNIMCMIECKLNI